MPISWSTLVARARAAPGPEALLAAGFAGDPSAVPWLLDRLADPGNARTAAAALEILLGAPCFEQCEIPDEDPSAPAQRAHRVSCARDAWRGAAAAILAAQPRNVRLRGGLPAAALTTAKLLDRPHLPPWVRQYLGYDLAARWGHPRDFDASALVRTQRAYLAKVVPAAHPQPRTKGPTSERVRR